MDIKDNQFEINGVKVGAGNPCFITFEAGPTHAGLDSAMRLAKYAKEAGGNAIKFQVFDPLRLVADPELPFTYQVLIDKETEELETVTEPLRDILLRRQLDNKEWKKLKSYCDEIGLAFFATACFHEDIDFLQEIGCDSIKIASADVNHLPFIRYAAKTGMSIQLDTGMASIGEIEVAVDAIQNEGNNKVIIHHCPSGYPAHLESVNLKVIPTLKNTFDCPVAFSDHSPGWDMDIAAVTIGANMIEKTITENRMTRSVEHVMSIEPEDMKKFVETIRGLEVALGNPRRVLSQEEKLKRNAIRRSVFITKDLPEGHVLTEQDIDYRRPGTGISPENIETVLNRKLVEAIKSGHQLSLSDLEAI